jgi:CheY-like chemotaxis protein
VGEVCNVLMAVAQRKGIALCTELDERVHELELDPARLRQALYNYLANAIKFTPQGGVVTVRARPEGATRWRLEVQDTGIGIAPENVPRLFKRFSQAEHSMVRRFGGTGLGLAISRKLVESMSGSIGVDSQPGQGSRFWFTLPATSANVRPLVPRERVVSLPSRSLKVLLVEDTPVNQLVSMGMLKRMGHRASLAEDGRAAVALATREQWDLILMDIQMPELDGLSATREIRAHELAHGLPRATIFALTASAMSDEQEACRQAGMDDVLSKPLTLDVLTARLARVA